MNAFVSSCRGPIRLQGLGLLALIGGLVLGRQVVAAEASPLARLAPDSAVVYFELEQSESLLNLLFDPRIKSLLEDNENWRNFQRSQQGTRLKAGLGMIEESIKMPWQQALRELTAGGVALAADPFERSSLLLIRAKNPDILARLRQFAIDLGTLTALASGKPSPLQASEHRGVEVWTVAGKVAYATMPDENLLIVSNARDSVVAAIDRALDGERSLADLPEFQQAQTPHPGIAARGFLQLEKFRSLPQWEKLRAAPRGNVGTESLFGGLIAVLDQASYLAFDATVTDGHLKLRWRTPFDQASVPASRQWFFAPADQDAAPPVLKPEGTILSVSLYRDHAGMWQQRNDLFDETTLAKLAQVESSLGLFFANRDFGSQVLGEFKPGSRLVIARQDFAEVNPVPNVKLPAFAAVVELKNPEEFSPILLTQFQTILGAINLDSAQKGRPQLLQKASEHRGTTVYHASYLSPPGEAASAVELAYNFRPACAVQGQYFIVASTDKLARHLIDELQRGDNAPGPRDNVRLVLSLDQLAATLADNQQALVTQNMLEKGNTRKEAEDAVALLLRILRCFGNVELRVTPGNETLEISAQLGLPELE